MLGLPVGWCCGLSSGEMSAGAVSMASTPSSSTIVSGTFLSRWSPIAFPASVVILVTTTSMGPLWSWLDSPPSLCTWWGSSFEPSVCGLERRLLSLLLEVLQTPLFSLSELVTSSCIKKCKSWLQFQCLCKL